MTHVFVWTFDEAFGLIFVIGLIIFAIASVLEDAIKEYKKGKRK